jgi:hypothetical protein
MHNKIKSYNINLEKVHFAGLYGIIILLIHSAKIIKLEVPDQM